MYKGTFRADRIIPIAERFGVDPKAVLDNIVVARVFTHEHQMQMLINVCALMVEQVCELPYPLRVPRAAECA